MLRSRPWTATVATPESTRRITKMTRLKLLRLFDSGIDLEIRLLHPKGALSSPYIAGDENRTRADKRQLHRRQAGPRPIKRWLRCITRWSEQVQRCFTGPSFEKTLCWLNPLSPARVQNVLLFLGRRQIPQAHRAIVTSGGDHVASRAEGQGVDRRRVPLERVADLVSRGCIPDPDDVVEAIKCKSGLKHSDLHGT